MGTSGAIYWAITYPIYVSTLKVWFTTSCQDARYSPQQDPWCWVCFDKQYVVFVRESHNRWFCSSSSCSSLTWKEEKKRSMNSLVSRRPMVVLVDSSVTKMKTTWWMPSRGIRVKVDLANLSEWVREREKAKDERRARNKTQPHSKRENVFSCVNRPEFIIRVSHLMRLEFWHKNFNNMDKDEEVDLWKKEAAELITRLDYRWDSSG